MAQSPERSGESSHDSLRRATRKNFAIIAVCMATIAAVITVVGGKIERHNQHVLDDVRANVLRDMGADDNVNGIACSTGDTELDARSQAYSFAIKELMSASTRTLTFIPGVTRAAKVPGANQYVACAIAEIREATKTAEETQADKDFPIRPPRDTADIGY